MSGVIPAADPRGEVLAVIGGRELKLRANFNMVRGVELRTGAGFFKVVSRTNSGNVHVGDLAAVLSEAASQAGTKLSYAEAGDLILRHSQDAAKAASDCMNAALSSEEAPDPKA